MKLNKYLNAINESLKIPAFDYAEIMLVNGSVPGFWKYWNQYRDKILVNLDEKEKNQLKEDVNKRFKDDNGYEKTILICAITGGDSEWVSKLIKEFNADPNLRSTPWTSPLMEACDIYSRFYDVEKSYEIVKILVESGAKVNDISDNGGSGNTAIYMLAGLGHLHRHCSEAELIKAMELLVKHGADINFITKGGWSVLMTASSAENSEVVKWLLSKGAKKDVKNESGVSALSLSDPEEFIRLNGKSFDGRFAENHKRSLEQKYKINAMLK